MGSYRLLFFASLGLAAAAACTSDPSTTKGPRDRMWLTEHDANKIAHITNDGVIVEIDVPTPNAKPFGIAAGPNDTVWFTEWGADKIAVAKVQ